MQGQANKKILRLRLELRMLDSKSRVITTSLTETYQMYGRNIFISVCKGNRYGADHVVASAP